MPKVELEEAGKGEKMKENLQVAAAVVIFGGGTLFFIVFMLFELIGKPLF